MLTEKSITQQLCFHKLPFPEDLGRGWATAVWRKSLLCLRKWASSHPRNVAPSASPAEEGEVGGDPGREMRVTGRRVLSQPGLTAAPFRELCRRVGIWPCLSFQRGKEVGGGATEGSSSPALKLFSVCGVTEREPSVHMSPAGPSSVTLPCWGPARLASRPPALPSYSSCA